MTIQRGCCALGVAWGAGVLLASEGHVRIATRRGRCSMSYKLPLNSSLELMTDYCTGVIAGLSAVPELEPLAGRWRERKSQLRAERDGRDDRREATIVAAKRVELRDALWDEALTALSGAAYHEAGKEASKQPYNILFGAVTAATATNLGPAKATGFGTTLLAKLAELNNSALAPTRAALEKANAELKAAHEARTAAETAETANEIRRIQTRDALELLIAETELAILQQFVGRRDLVRAIVATPRSKGKKEQKVD